MPFVPIRSYDLSTEDLEALESLTRPYKENESEPTKPTVDIEGLTKQAENL